MQWIIFAFLSAVGMAGAHIFNKKALIREHALEFTASRAPFIILLSLFLIPFVDFGISLKVYAWIFGVQTLVSIGLLFLMKSFRHGEVSLVSPLMNLSPLFLVLIAFFVLGEALVFRQYMGVVVLVIGAYMLQIGVSGHKLSDPLKALTKSKVVHYLLFAVIIFSVTATLDKLIIKDYADFMTYLFLAMVFQSLNFIIIDLYRYGLKEIKANLKKDFSVLSTDSLFVFFTNVFYFAAVSVPQAPISLIVPIRRMSTLFTTIFGGKLFHEKNLMVKVMACIIMIWGTIFILL